MELQEICQQMQQAFGEYLEIANLKPGQVVVIGCSTSEVHGGRIGKDSQPDIAAALYEVLAPMAEEKGIYLAFQCCEHLNRALIVEEKCAEKYSLEPVNVIPQPKAGGSFATTAWNSFEKPCAVEHINAHAGIDIGDTLIGMHLRHVAVPVRLSVSTIGKARIVCARTRAKFIGGIRAIYDETKI